jgi:hypothetical protein
MFEERCCFDVDDTFILVSNVASVLRRGLIMSFLRAYCSLMNDKMMKVDQLLPVRNKI